MVYSFVYVPSWANENVTPFVLHVPVFYVGVDRGMRISFEVVCSVRGGFVLTEVDLIH